MIHARVLLVAAAYLGFCGVGATDKQKLPSRPDSKTSQHPPQKSENRTATYDSLVVVGSEGIPVTMISFGDSPLQSVLLDLGSSFTWASASHTSSKSLQRSDQTVSIDYIGTTVSGVEAKDTVHIASLSASLQFGLSDEDLDQNGFNGLVGLAQGPAPTLMDSLHNAGAITEKILTLRVPDQHNTGLVTFGANAVGPVEFLASNDYQSWATTVSDAIVDGQSMNVGPLNAIIDSGNARMAVGTQNAAIINRALGAVTTYTDRYYIPCDAKRQLQLRIGNSVLLISPETYVGVIVGENLCESLITGSQPPGFDWSLGMPFLASVDIFLDYSNHRMGFRSRTNGEFSGGAVTTSLAASGSAGTATKAIAMMIAVWVWCTPW